MLSFQENNGPQLTDSLALNVSQRLMRDDIRKLFSFLRIEGHIVEATFENNINNTNETAHKLMTEWRKRMTGSEEAYTALWKALTDQEVNLASIAYEVLKEPPTDKITTESPDKCKLSTITQHKCKP